MKSLITHTVGILAILLSQSVVSETVIELEGAEIRGNREQPKVLYIVPWQTPSATGDLYKPLTTLVSDALVPLERDVFEREVRFYQDLNPISKP